MTPQQIKAYAPAGATHHVGGTRFYRHDEFWKEWFYWRHSERTWVIVKKPSGSKPL